MSTLQQNVHYPSRVLMSLLFLISGSGKLTATKPTQEYMEAYGVPGSLIYPAATFEIISGVLLLVDRETKHLGWLLAGWCILTAAIFHTEFKDQTQLIMFLKNMTMAGSFLALSAREAETLARR